MARAISLELPETARRVEEEIEAGLLMLGAQICVVARDHVLDLTLGEAGIGRELTPETIFKVYCTTKPITAVAVAKLLDAGLAELDEPLGAKLPKYRALSTGDITLRHILTHTAGLHGPGAVQMEVMPPQMRQGFLERTVPPPGWRFGVDAGYSEVLGWHLLGRFIEVTTGDPLRDHLRESVLDPLGLHNTWIGMTLAEWEVLYPRFGVNCGIQGPDIIPGLGEIARRVCCDVNCSYGGYTSARDLAQFYARLLARMNGADDPALPTPETLSAFCSRARPPSHDRAFDRECTYGLGFMVDLRGHHFGDHCSAMAFGHSGLVGSSFALGDPQQALAVAVILNGVIDYEASFLRRAALLRAIYADVARML